MSKHVLVQSRVLIFSAMVGVFPLTLFAGHQLFRNGSVGGVSIDPTGTLREPVKTDTTKWLEVLRRDVKGAPKGLEEPVELRKISLRRLEEAIAEAVRTGGVLPDEIKYLAGLQRIQYVFLYPDEHDIVLAGPGDGWRWDIHGDIVGATTGRPVLMLDDLSVALRCANNARQGQGISCSINPTQEGRQRFAAYMKSLGTIKDFNEKRARDAMGAQTITITGVPTTSHFARVLVAADYKMKRYAMKLEPSPVKGMPSFLDLLKVKRGRLTNAMPRWWMACNYQPLAKSEDGLAWELRGQGVKAMTEDDFIAADGTQKGSGGKNPIAEQWAKTMTEKYDELAGKDAVFAELRNLMDMCVVAALLEKEDMLNMVGLELPLLTGQREGLRIRPWYSPKTVDTQVSAMKAGREFLITASGGVQVESWEVAGKTEKSTQVGQVRTRVKVADKKKWWWN